MSGGGGAGEELGGDGGVGIMTIKRREFFIQALAWLVPLMSLGRWGLRWVAPQFVRFKLIPVDPAIYGKFAFRHILVMSKGRWEWVRLKVEVVKVVEI